MLNKIHVKNFKCFKDMEIELSNLNVFAGINSMGKSTVIQAILLLRQSYEGNFISHGLQLNGNLINLGTGYDVLCRESDKDEFSIIIENNNKQFEWEYDYSKELNIQKLKSNVIDKDTIEEVAIFSPNFSYISADRIGPRSFYEKKIHHIFDINNVGYHGELFANYLAEKGMGSIGSLNVKHNEVDSLTLIYQFEAWISEISPGIKVQPKKYSGADIISIGYSIEKEEYTPLNVGFGISYTAPIIVSLLKAKKGDLIIIENPEAHLHPKGQRKLGELISRACEGGVQIIVETHSDHLLNGIRLSVKNKDINRDKIRLNYFYQDIEINSLTLQKKVVHKKCSPMILEDGRLSHWPEGFFDEWDKAVEELF